MNNQKDIQKTDINSYGQTGVSNAVAFNNKSNYDFANKKTEKLVTALYMVTDCMDTDDALKVKLRFLGVELLSDMYKVSALNPIDKGSHISTTLNHINELLSFIEIVSTIGFISEMNSSILHREFMNLSTELASYQSKDKQFTFTLSDSMFDVVKQDEEKNLRSNVKDNNTSNGHIFKKAYSPSSFLKENTTQSIPKRLVQNTINPSDKKERTDKILSLIKDRANKPGSESGISIKDISIAFTDVSEKTIQRELNLLVTKGLLRKIGSKRWSRYQSL